MAVGHVTGFGEWGGRFALQLCRLMLPLGLCLATLEDARAASPAPDGSCLRTPFAQQIDVDTVTALAHTPPQSLLERITKLDIDVLRVPSAGPGEHANPLLVALPVADAQLLRQAQFLESYQGRSIPAGAQLCGRKPPTGQIRVTASSYTLLHEVVHLLLIPADGALLRSDRSSSRSRFIV
jgi:hypothetical protein